MHARLRTLVLVAALAIPRPALADPPPRVQIVFDPSAAGLPETQIRSALELELGRLEHEGSLATGSALHVGVNAEGALVLSYEAPGEIPSERVLHRPEDDADVAELIALAAATLARTQPGESVPAPAAPATPPDRATHSPASELEPKPHTPSRSPAPPLEKPSRDFIGIEGGPDLLLVPSRTGVCNPQPGNGGALYRCYVPGGNPVTSQVEGRSGAIQGGYLTGSSRLLLSYDHALTRRVRVGGRLGVVLGTAPVSAGPSLHMEGRVAYRSGSPGAGAWRPALFGGLGVSRSSGRTSVRIENDRNHELLSADAFADVGLLFLSGGAGITYQPTSSIELDASLALTGYFPAFPGVALTPALAARVAL